MTVVVRKEKRKNNRVYYKLYDVKRVNGKVKSKYVGYLGKDPISKNEISYGEMMQYVQRLMDIEISDSDPEFGHGKINSSRSEREHL